MAKGLARLYVYLPPEDWPSGVEVPVAGQIYYNAMEVKPLFDAWHNFLLLPESYKVVGVYYEPPRQSWLLIVESEDIPLPPRDELLPIITSRYQVEYLPEGRRVSLTDFVLS